ncbi:MAG: hypothetical protein HYZ10_08100 [Ignavibacteriales bacterium]|nr:hypothetical protein [Ignavibacteriales bacterium]
MKNLCIFVFLIILFNNLSAQNKETTHNLELLTPNVEKPYILDVSIYSKGSINYIQIQFPDELILTEYISTDSAQIKFQTSKISDDKLVTIQFIGSGIIEEQVNGKFTALVDGVLRDDMSGKFVLSKK